MPDENLQRVGCEHCKLLDENLHVLRSDNPSGQQFPHPSSMHFIHDLLPSSWEIGTEDTVSLPGRDQYRKINP